jgi:hypothetical protein
VTLPGGFPLAGGDPELEALLGVFIARQEWAQVELRSLGARSIKTRLLDMEVLVPGRAGLASIVVEAGEKETSRLHVVVGWRPINDPVVAPLRPGAVIGTGADDDGEVVFYDALSDPALCLELLSVATAGRQRARRARLVQSLVSHSALVFDERLFMKCYRVIEPRPRLEIEMMTALDKMGFNHLLAPLGHWSRASGDLGLVREFLPGAVEGKALALTSLRDLLARAVTGEDAPSFGKVGLAGGDLGDESRRLGTTTAEMHLALAEAFGLEQQDGLPSVRLHGDYHLRRVMRFEAGWLVAGFGDDPLMSEAGSASQGGAKRGSVLSDISDLFVSFGQVAAEAVALQPPSTLTHSRRLASGWVRHNAGTFLDGYLATPGVERLLPIGREDIVRRLIGNVRARLASLGLTYGA